MKRRMALLAVLQLTLVGVAVAPQLSARILGEEYQLVVRALDPVDPFRGAYVTLTYPGLRSPADSQPGSMDDGREGDVFVTLVQDGEVWRSGEYSRSRPESGPYLACNDLDWQIRCGIESWFVPQDDAVQLERALADEGAIATVKVDARGNASVVALDPR